MEGYLVVLVWRSILQVQNLHFCLSISIFDLFNFFSICLLSLHYSHALDRPSLSLVSLPWLINKHMLSLAFKLFIKFSILNYITLQGSAVSPVLLIPQEKALLRSSLSKLRLELVSFANSRDFLLITGLQRFSLAYLSLHPLI